MSEIRFPYERLKQWFLSNRRSLPWRDLLTPYGVWISEVMLQQTQVAVVIPYFQRWMEVFPTIHALAEAPLETVLKIWEGLGYYSRARHLHEAARFVVQHYGGELPDDSEKLAKIKGIGPYTQGAILSFAFKKKAAAIDGNVRRVLSRYFMQDKVETSLAESILPDEEPWLVTEGLIELGAMICQRRPKCGECPLMQSCLAFRHGREMEFPRPKKRPKTTKLSRYVAVIRYHGKVLLRRGERGKIMADLYEFPYIDVQEGSSVQELFEQELGLELSYISALSTQEHTFTRFHVTLYPHLFESKGYHAKHLWFEESELNQLPFSSGHKKIITGFVSTCLYRQN